MLKFGSLLCCGIFISFFLGYKSHAHFIAADPLLLKWEAELNTYRVEINDLKSQLRYEMDALNDTFVTARVKLLKLDVLGQEVLNMANLDPDEFDFNDLSTGDGLSCETVQPLPAQLPIFQSKLDDKYHDMQILKHIMSDRLSSENRALFGKGPKVKNSWISSYYGARTHPVTHKKSFHPGVDIAGPVGSEIKSVATGVVTFSGERGHYGRLVEVSHGNGLATRYAHNKSLIVKRGDIVQKGQILALLGQSGRVTGPHVHFEVRHHGKAVDPGLYFPGLAKKTSKA